ncbi:MAG: hypothetical protein IJI68_04430 [Eggerthellaceae bacterium]|jgi:hypothetical protein|nr:hypothetical protein [Eggerthellaceae bacterium]
MNFEDLTPEQIEKAKACKTAEELVQLAEAEGVKLSNEQLEAISGGGVDWDCFLADCPHY